MVRERPLPLPKENIYGHLNRLHWIRHFLDKNQRILEFGCGTGYMITFPLRKIGFNVVGVDTDDKSIGFGLSQLNSDQLPFLRTCSLSEINDEFEVIIASEVLEHIPDSDLDSQLEEVKKILVKDGLFLVTVPNGYGWFELEHFLWWGVGIGSLLEKLKIVSAVQKLKSIFGCDAIDAVYPSTLSSSPHVQRFTLKSITEKLTSKGFRIVECQGSVLICGPFSNLLFSGVGPVLRINIWLGGKLTRFASGFYLACRKR
ncbi:MAG: class I SAM-dependent methyltransferase [Elusimicrobia bacterium]|nr:class I SAM-dependent methyltransferase [Candidatus Obscuribacterium magneticum]